MMGRWLTDRIEDLVRRMARGMPADRQEWGEAVVAEFAAIPPRERRLRWALGGLWFVLRGRSAPATRPTAGWLSRVFSMLGIIGMSPWILSSIYLVSDDAPDARMRSLVPLLVAQCVLVAAFLATWWPWRTARVLIVVALVGFAVTVAFHAADNGGYPVQSALIFTTPFAMAAAPILLIGALRGRRP
jgi:hypothetical protein